MPKVTNHAFYNGQQETGTPEWVTPISLVDRLGEFDLDPCSPVEAPWRCAKRWFTLPGHDGLMEPWEGRVWLNPPYGDETPRWIDKMLSHGNGIALVFARTETKWFQRALSTATAVLLGEGRLGFYLPNGTRPRSQGPAGNALIAYGEENHHSLEMSGLSGIMIRNFKLLEGRSMTSIIERKQP